MQLIVCQNVKLRALMTPTVLEWTGIQPMETVNTAGLVDLGPDAGTSMELLESLTMTSPEIVKVNVSVYTA